MVQKWSSLHTLTPQAAPTLIIAKENPLDSVFVGIFLKSFILFEVCVFLLGLDLLFLQECPGYVRLAQRFVRVCVFRFSGRSHIAEFSRSWRKMQCNLRPEVVQRVRKSVGRGKDFNVGKYMRIYSCLVSWH